MYKEYLFHWMLYLVFESYFQQKYYIEHWSIVRLDYLHLQLQIQKEMQ
jgi:hypothetical protein